MYLLGIETSCDETAAAVLHDGSRLLSNVVSSQFDIHAKYGGVVPELASREHLRAIVPVVREALDRAAIGYRDLAAVGVTYGPGLIGPLLVGLTYAKGMAASLGIPLIGVNHIEGHIHAVVLEQQSKGESVAFPALALVVSGGHSHLFFTERSEHGVYSYKLVGRTRDDAAGEAFDKVAKLLGFGYPGGPLIDKLAPYGDPQAIPLPSSRMKGNPLDMSFSGLKSAVLRFVRASDLEAEIVARKKRFSGSRFSVEQARASASATTLNLLAAFQARVIEELLRRAAEAAHKADIESIIVSGGVAANSGLRKRFSSLPYPVYFPSLALATDNAAMIAAAAYPRFLRSAFHGMDLAAQPSLSLA